MNDAYARSVSEVLEAFGVDPTKGLTDFQVAENAKIYGRNVLPQEESTPFWKRVLNQFDDLLVKILIAAAIVSFLLALINGETGLTAFLEPSVIFMILAANAAVGVITETNAEKALVELRAYQADVATVLRNGCFSILPATELVPGDIVEVGVGCKVPADMRLVEMLSSQLRVDQAILTGESCSVAKDLESTVATNAVYQDKTNILFSGTVVVAGRARAIVVGVGSNTAMGSIRDAMLRTVDEATPLKKKLDEFGTFLAKVIAGICVLVWVVNIGHFRDPSHGGFMRGAIHYFKVFFYISITQLIYMIYIEQEKTNRLYASWSFCGCFPSNHMTALCPYRCLALGTKRMARLNAIVRSLPSVETLGCTTVICSDKTGTLTTNMMSVSKVIHLNGFVAFAAFCNYLLILKFVLCDFLLRKIPAVHRSMLSYKIMFDERCQIIRASLLIEPNTLLKTMRATSPPFSSDVIEAFIFLICDIASLLGRRRILKKKKATSPEATSRPFSATSPRAMSLPFFFFFLFHSSPSSSSFSALGHRLPLLSPPSVCVVQSVHRGPITNDYAVTGTTFAPEGMIFDSAGMQLEFPAQFPCLLHIAMCSALCNESILQYNPDKKNYDKIGESTEVALRVLVEKVGLPGFDSMPSALNILSKHERASYCNRYWEHQFKKICVLEFSRDRKMMSVLCSRKQQEIMFSKGAPESIITRCTHILCNEDGSSIPLTTDIRNELDERFKSFAGKDTLRCLALALKRMPMGQQTICHEDETNLTFIGLVGMLDPPREEVRNAILSCMSAGIRVIVVTGDNKTTAESLCRRIGAFEHLNDFTGYSYTASEFEELPPLQQTLALQRMVLFTRVEPSHKKMLVEALQNQNEVVAMTGDGVNDAPALKKADIGIAMGSGTAVAKSASDMVLADDNFASIVAAVAEGRAIYNNTKQFIRYMISSNIGEVVCIFVAAVLGMPDTLVPVQLLWVNLVTDGLPATAIGFNKQDTDVMMAKPRKVSEAVVTGWLFFRYLVIGAYVGLATITGFVWWFVYSDKGPKLPYYELVNFDSCPTRETSYPCSIFDDRHPSTVSMTVLVVVEMFNALNNLSENQSLLVIPPWSNPWLLASIALTMLLHVVILYVEPLSMLFSVTPLSWTEWTIVMYLSFPVIIIDEVLKFFSRNSRGRRFGFRFRRPEALPREARDK
ncbi:unnamed protein product [Musa textilis]